MTDEPNGPDEHSQRVHAAFDELRAALGDRVTPEARESFEKLRSAVLENDAAGVRARLADVKRRYGWLYKELSLHRRVAEIVNELALMGL
jgi:hypothetical protein